MFRKYNVYVHVLSRVNKEDKEKTSLQLVFPLTITFKNLVSDGSLLSLFIAIQVYFPASFQFTFGIVCAGPSLER